MFKIIILTNQSRIFRSSFMELSQSQGQKILIMGGTNFMGKTLLDMLAELKPLSQVYCINRGKIYWNNQARIHNKYKHYVADRKEHKDSMMMVRYLNQKLKISNQNKWKAVIDFSGFKWRDIQSVVKEINGLAERYIYISSDSIYNNSLQKVKIPVKQDDFNIEVECLRLRRIQKKNDKYGYVNFDFIAKNKLKCEVYIKKRSQVPSYCLRLPDVIGPYDNTDRFWTTIEWVKRSHEYPIPLSAEDQQKPLSFVYSVDVCRFILQLIERPNPKNEFINLGHIETPTLEDLIRIIAKMMALEPRFKAVKEDSNNCYPSTQFGYISVQKMFKQYSFEPTPFEQAIFETLQFFNLRGDQFSRERGEMQRLLQKKIKYQDS